MNDQSNGNSAPEPPETDLVTLDDVYEKAFIGPSFSVTEPPRAAYSLTILAQIERRRLNCDLEKARESILALMQAVTGSYGSRAPLFIDTSQSLRPRKECSRIIRPRGFSSG